MKNLPYGERCMLFLLFLSLSGCDFDDDAVMNPSSWAAIVVAAAMLPFFYYVFKMSRRK
ncbi:hypothetical protein [Pontibacter pamirensis]|uniref:hypothetical protein n=1 Tax=Pontibacter pamirensis TaxID=2562824 RepID=UPI0013898393|nr:hypothetical protein [Pontibacter pamirensis]